MPPSWRDVLKVLAVWPAAFETPRRLEQIYTTLADAVMCRTRLTRDTKLIDRLRTTSLSPFGSSSSPVGLTTYRRRVAFPNRSVLVWQYRAVERGAL